MLKEYNYSSEYLPLNLISLWLISKSLPSKLLSKKEEEIFFNLNQKEAIKYAHSRSHLRYVLSKLFNLNPLEVPLYAPLGKAPYLERGMGYLSFSHCKDALLIGWSNNLIGVDIENKNRKFNAKSLMERFYSPNEKKKLKKINDNDKLRLSVLKHWVLKEGSIKFQKSTIAKDLGNWEFSDNFDIGFNKVRKLSTSTNFISFKDWYIGVASNQKKDNLILCIVD